MPRLYGRDWTKTELLRRVGDVRQVGGLRPFVLDDGPARGVRCVEVRTGAGFSYAVALDRGLDIPWAELDGMPLAWVSPTGVVHPAMFDPPGLGWLRGFFGGLVTTCGLTSAGPPDTDEGETFGLHGRVSHLPASEVSARGVWVGNDYEMTVEGRVREVSVFGLDLQLNRRSTSRLGGWRIVIRDEVENLGSAPAPHMLIYHVNAGFPLVSEDAELITPALQVEARDADAQPGIRDWHRFDAPQAGYREQVFFHTLSAVEEEDTMIALVNRKLGLGYALRWPLSQLPAFTEWKMMGEGTYVVGTEPGNCRPLPRSRLRKEKSLVFLRPGQRRGYELEIDVLTGADEIRAAEKRIRAARNPTETVKSARKRR